MNYRLSILILLLFPFALYARDTDTSYFNSKWLPCDRIDAAYFRAFTKDAAVYKAETYTIGGRLLMTGHVATIKWNNKHVYENQRNGNFVFYNIDGQKIKEGTYVNGVCDGKWLYYLPGDDKSMEEDYYTEGRLDSSRSVDKETGRLIYATYTGRGDGLKESVNFEYYASGKVKKMYFSNGKKRTTQCMDENGTVILCDTITKASGDSLVEELPVPPFNIIRFLSENVIYPESARATNKKGRAIISFVVMEDGKLACIKPVNTVCPEIDEEAMRVIALMPEWKPGMQNGKVVKVVYTQPLMFKLQ